MEVSKFVGEKIKYFRNKKGITQQELGEYLNTTSQTISRYESGILEANQNILFKLADYFDISINDFFPPLDNDNSEIDSLLFSKVKELSEEDKKAVLSVVNAIHKDIDKELDN